MIPSGDSRSCAPGQVQLTSERHQALLERHGLRSSMGSFYTPLDVVERVLEISIGSRITAVNSIADCPSVVDPSCGTGNFLVIVALRLAEQIAGRGVPYETAIDHVVERRIFGCDIDPVATEHCARNLSMLTDGRVAPADVIKNLHVGDALAMTIGEDGSRRSLFEDDAPDSWESAFPSVFSGVDPGFDVVVGNPPFLNQLSIETSLDPAVLEAIRSRYGDAVSRLSNPASVFFLVGMGISASSGTIALIQPLSFLATRDGAGIRRTLAGAGCVRSVWVCSEQVFDANVSIVTVSLTKGSRVEEVEVHSGRSGVPVGTIPTFTVEEPTWSRAMARSRGFPTVEHRSGGTFADMCQVASDFRDQYYGLVGHVVDNPDPLEDEMKLATVGLVDPGDFGWGRTSTKFAKATFVNPVVRVRELSPKMQKWVESRRVPKVLIATQTKVMECFVDADGSVLPSVPLITLVPGRDRLFHVAAALTSPVVSLVAAERHLGAGISADVLKLSGQDVLRLPVPEGGPAWDEGAQVFGMLQSAESPDERASLVRRLGTTMNEAYGVDDEGILDWWLSRLPRTLRKG